MMTLYSQSFIDVRELVLDTEIISETATLPRCVMYLLLDDVTYVFLLFPSKSILSPHSTLVSTVTVQSEYDQLHLNFNTI